jgi:hypothetical protein
VGQLHVSMCAHTWWCTGAVIMAYQLCSPMGYFTPSCTSSVACVLGVCRCDTVIANLYERTVVHDVPDDDSDP